MRIKTSQIYKAIIYFIIAWDTVLLSMFNFDPGGKRYSIMVTVGLIMTIIIIVTKTNNKYLQLFRWLKIYGLITICMLIVHYIHDVAINQIDIYAFMHNACYYAIFLLGFPMILIMEKDEKNFWKYINCLMFVWYTWILIQYLAYQSSGTILSPYLNSNGLLGNNLRNGNLRLEIKVFGHLAILYNFDKFYNTDKWDRKKKYNLIMVLYGLFCLIAVEQTRGYYIAIFASIAVLVLSYNRDINKVLVTSILIIITCIMMWKMNIIGNLFNSLFDSSGAYDKGATGLIRLKGMQMFWNGFIDNPMFALGFQSTGDAVNVGLVMFYFNDNGFLGIIGQIGIWAFVLYGLMLLRFMYIVIKMFKMKQHVSATLLLGLWVYLLLTSISLICYWNSTCMLCPVLWAIFEVKYYKGKINYQLIRNREKEIHSID